MSVIDLDGDLDISGAQQELQQFADGIHPNLKQLSNSSDVTLHKCPRKFELNKLATGIAFEQDEHLDFGTIVGIGTQELLETNSLDKAHFKMMCKWDRMLDDEDGAKAKKTFWHGLYAIDKFVALRNGPFSEYDLAEFQGKPATELGFSIDCGDGFHYRGFLDALLIHRIKKHLAVYEGKTTGTRTHEAVYKHSGQALGYDLVVEAISQRLELPPRDNYDVHYAIYQSKQFEWEHMKFNKSHTQRALWIRNILIDKQHISDYAAQGYFPMHGESCYDFFRPCPHFGTCELSNEVLLDKNIPVRVDDPTKYQFHFSLEELIEAQLRRHG